MKFGGVVLILIYLEMKLEILLIRSKVYPDGILIWITKKDIS